MLNQAKNGLIRTLAGEPAHPLTLAFRDPGLEADFGSAYFLSILNLGRACHVLAAAFYGLFMVWDLLSPGGIGRAGVWLPVFGVVLAMFALGLFASFRFLSFYRRWWTHIYTLYVLVTGLGFTLVTVYGRDSRPGYGYMGIVFCLVFCYAFIRLRFVWAVLGGWIITAVYLAASYADGRFRPDEAFYLVGLSLLLMLVCYFLELGARRVFVLAHLLGQAKEQASNANTRLEAMVKERTGELTLANQGLVEAVERERELVRRLTQDEARLSQNLAALHQAEEMAGLGYFERNWVSGEGYWSRGFHALLGVAPGQIENSHEEFAKFIHPEDRNRVNGHIRSSLANHTVMDIEFRLVRKNGEIIDIHGVADNVYDDASRPHVTRGTFQDVTRQKKAEAEGQRLAGLLRQAQKMEAIGALAGGVAHDFNNILGVISGYIELTLMDLPGVQRREQLAQALKAAGRAKELVKQILAFSRQGERDLLPVRLADIIGEALRFVRATLPATIEIKQEITAGRRLVLADPTQLHQVMMNLCANAGHALGEAGGRLEISLSEMEVEPGLDGLGLKPGAYLRLVVSDTGCGMDRATLERIFDPYFTTKPSAEGTGLGLSVVHGIVLAHGGAIRAYSEPGVGTSFHVYLPVLAEGRQAHEEARPAPPRGTERVAYVDDEEALAQLGRHMLERLGYRVRAFTDSSQALEAVLDPQEGYDLLITDQTMPRMTGLELAERAMAARPGLPVILCTGFSRLVSEEKARQAGIKGFMMKPLVFQELAELVREVLDKERDSSPTRQ